MELYKKSPGIFRRFFVYDKIKYVFLSPEEKYEIQKQERRQ
jgi:hypothetical protein